MNPILNQHSFNSIRKKSSLNKNKNKPKIKKSQAQNLKKEKVIKEKLKQYAINMGYKDMRGLRRGEYDEEE